MHFVRPEVVGEVRYGEYTAAGHLRHPTWRGLRPDKPAKVRRALTRISAEAIGEPGAQIQRRPAVSPDRVETEVDGRRLSLSNLEKVLYPDTGFTKAAIIDYYARIAPVMLPHLPARPFTMRRFPNGVSRGRSSRRTCRRRAAVSGAVTVPSTSSRDAGSGRSPTWSAMDRPTLLWAANLAAIELHVPLWRDADARLPGPPDHLVFDLDPGPGTTVVECAGSRSGSPSG